MTIVVHHLNESRSQRVLFLLEELGVPYEITFYQRNRRTMLAPPELKKVHPLGKSPVVVDDGTVLAETGLIIDQLIARHGQGTNLRPADGTPDRLKYEYYLHYGEGSLMPFVLLSLIFARVPAETPFLVRPVAKLIASGVTSKFIGPNVSAALDYLEQQLADRPWFAGEHLTGADAMMSYPLQALASRGGLGTRTRIADWIARLEARPAWTRAVEKGGKLNFSFG